MAKIYSINISEKKGTVKKPVPSCEVMFNYGIVDDAHRGDWHRQISLLDFEAIEQYNEKGFDIKPGAFAENITTQGLDLEKIKIGDVLRLGDVVVEITQIGKECHGGCEIKKQTGDCIMPKRGLFAKVLRGGTLTVGTKITVYPKISAGVLTLSDKGFAGEREDKSGEVIKETIKKINAEVIKYEILPDDRKLISNTLLSWSEEGLDLILTTGGTGITKRDVTPEATRDILRLELPGFGEMMRISGMKHTPNAILSRGICGICKNTIILNLPGSPKAVLENLETVMDALPHAVALLKRDEKECGRE